MSISVEVYLIVSLWPIKPLVVMKAIRSTILWFQDSAKETKSLLAIAVGIKQKAIVDQIVQKVYIRLYLYVCFIEMIWNWASLQIIYCLNFWFAIFQFFLCNFIIILFHYDGVVDEWRDLEWSGSALHVSASNQTKWYKSW